MTNAYHTRIRNNIQGLPLNINNLQFPHSNNAVTFIINTIHRIVKGFVDIDGSIGDTQNIPALNWVVKREDTPIKTLGIRYHDRNSGR